MDSLAPESEAKLKKLLEQDEGVRQFPYQDTKGNWTIGVGHNLSANGISKPIIDAILDYDISICEAELSKNLPIYNGLDDIRKIVLIDMCFNCGFDGLMAFRKMLEAIQNDDFATAGKEILNSEIAENRKQRLAYIMETGIL